MIHENFQGRPLHVECGSGRSLKSFLKIAVQLAEALATLHKTGIVHKNIRPGNILLDAREDRVKLIGLNSEAEPEGADKDCCRPEYIREVLAYISPEQTGRMKQSVAVGTDFYSLGVVLYELLTGRPPFPADDPLALIHAHMAAAPKPPALVNRAVPQVVSDIIMKLLAKSPAERYCNGFGLLHDLQECIRRLEESGGISPFPIGRKDFSPHFLISRKMIGRKAEMAELQAVFERVAQGPAECVLIGGAAGIGKSALIHEFQRIIAAGGAYCVAGKYDQFRGKEPYAPLYQALKDLIRQVLAESPQAVQRRKQQLLAALGVNARIVTEALPEIELIIGPQPEISPLGPAEEKNRFQEVWKNFIRVFATVSHPLVVFMDDLQWADEESIDFMQQMVSPGDCRSLLWIGAYRESPAAEGEPEAGPAWASGRLECRVTHLCMRPMDLLEVNLHVAATLGCATMESFALAELIHAKTGGNPLFINQFMRVLYDKQLLTFAPAQGWCWDMGAIRKQAMAENVATLLADHMENLPRTTRELLKVCACIGVRFDPAVAAAVMDQSLAETMAGLKPALTEGLIEPADSGYCFSHDRIQEAAYERIHVKDRPLLNYRIGRQILSGMAGDLSRGKLFYVVNKLNAGIGHITSPEEKMLLRGLNLAAGRRARSAAAYARAADFFRTALELLPMDAWEKEYEQALDIHLNLAVCEHLNHRFEEARHWFDLALDKAVTGKDQAEVYNLKLLLLAGLTRFPEALDAGRQGLALLGLKLPQKVGKLTLIRHMLRIRMAMGLRKPADLNRLPVMTDEAKFTAMKILMNLTMTAYFISADLGILVALMMLELSLKYGNSPVSPYAYAVYGVVMGSGFGKIHVGAEFGRLARNLDSDLGSPEIRAKITLTVGGGIMVWNQPVHEGLALTRKALIAAMENGDLNSAVYAVQSIVILMGFQGAGLEEIGTECRRHLDFITRTKDPGALNSLLSILQFTKSLRGETKPLFSLDDANLLESDHMRKMAADGIPIILGRHYILKMQLHYLLGRYDLAHASALESEKLIHYSLGMIVTAEHYFYLALIALALAGSAAGKRKRVLYKKALACERRIRKWAKACPANFRHKDLLIRAERARLEGRDRPAMDDFAQAVSSAKENGFIQNAALAAERAALFYLNLGHEKLAGPFMNEAHYFYQKWGASAKAEQLALNYPQLIKKTPSQDLGGPESRRERVLSIIDLRTLRSTLKTLAEETIYSRMVEKTLRTSIQIAGAQKGLLILRNEAKELFIEGEGSIDREEVAILQSIPMDSSTDIFQAAVNYVRRTGEMIVVHDVEEPHPLLPHLQTDPYIRRTGVKSFLCLPILVTTSGAKELLGLVYLENNRAIHAFTTDMVEMLEIICLSAAGRLELSRKAVRDGLTGLYNHDYFQNVLQQEMILSQRQGRQLSLVMIDIDHFKQFNDTWGHQVGDTVLQQVSAAIGIVCRKSDIIARYGGEEIAVILRETDSQTAYGLSEKLRKTIAGLEIIHTGQANGPLRVTVSLGVASYPRDAADKTGLIQMADKALYRSKAAGRNRVTEASNIEARNAE